MTENGQSKKLYLYNYNRIYLLICIVILGRVNVKAMSKESQRNVKGKYK